MTDLRQAAQQALEALKFANVNHWWGSLTIEKATTALRTALEQQAEPVACQSCQDIGGNWAWKCNLCGEVDESREPEPPQRKPLTDDLGFEDALRIALGCKDYGGGYLGNVTNCEIYQHGIQTVINALRAAQVKGLGDT